MTISPEQHRSADVRLIGLRGVPDVRQGDDLAAIVLAAADATGIAFAPGDILVVTQKVVSKAEGCLVDLREIEPSPLARRIAEPWGKDPRYIEVVLRESVRIVRMERGLVISQTRHGFVCANAGVDASNVAGGDVACLLPVSPDASARALHEALRQRTGTDVPVIISDSFGRPWRSGIVNVAIGLAGMPATRDYRGEPDDYGRVMHASLLAIADEVASAAELVSGKVNRCPFVLVRGYDYPRGDGRAADLVMDASMDLFR